MDLTNNAHDSIFIPMLAVQDQLYSKLHVNLQVRFMEDSLARDQLTND